MRNGPMLLCNKNNQGFLAGPVKPAKQLVWLCVWFGSALLSVPPLAAEPNTLASSDQVFSQACELIYEGQFADADRLSKQVGCAPGGSLKELSAITAQYAQLKKRREVARQETYKDGWDKLLQLQSGADTNEPNDANDPAAVLSVAASLMEYADDEQKSQIMAQPDVQESIRAAKAKAAEYEVQGKWLDAYTSCYYWLTLIDKDNKQYEDYAEQLIEKANIVASFQDSPCETRSQRYQNIEEDMFKKAIEVIDIGYVNVDFLDYSKMALRAIERCRTLAEVVKASYSQIQDPNAERQAETVGEPLYCPDANSIAAWSTALDAIKSDIEQSSNSISVEKFLDVYEKVLLLNKTTVALPDKVLIAHFAEAALSVLDPHTVLVWPVQTKDFKKNLTGEFAGIGILISKEKGMLTAASLLPDTPAYRSGLDAGDVIEAVDGIPTKGMSLNCAVKYITGPVGTDVKLTVMTPGQEGTRDIVITRAKIVVNTIRGWKRTETGQWVYMIDDERKVGYIRITNFSEKTPKDFEKVLTSLEKQGLRGLVVDLRFNQGGLLGSAVKVADMFIRKGLIVRTVPRVGFQTFLTAHESGTHPDYPVVILVNRFSASASEIVAGALQDPKYKRAVVVGDRTHGKGSVQAITYRPGGGAELKYTMAYYHLPSGEPVKSREDMEKLGRDDWGIAPNVWVKLTSEEIKQMNEVQRDNDVLVKADHDLTAAPLKKHSVEETLAADPQLTVGLLIVKTKLIEQTALARSSTKKAMAG